MKLRLPFHSNAVWPAPLLVTIFITAYGLVALCLWAIEQAAPKVGVAMANSDEIRNIRAVILAGAAGLYAVARLWQFHPACNSGYATWLKMSPWTAAKPLPLGPVHLVWQDGAVIGALAAIAYWHAHVDPSRPLVAFGFAYLVGFTLLLALMRQWRTCVELALLWPTLMLTQQHRALGLATLGAIIVVIWHGHRRSLRAFPWPASAGPRATVTSLGQIDINLDAFSTFPAAGKDSNGPTLPPTNGTLGWPVRVLSPKIKPPAISHRTNLALATIIGWWCYCIVESTQMPPVPELLLIFACGVAATRLGIYYNGVMPPFNFLGRMSSGRLIVPGFDKIFLAPLAVVALAVFGGMIIKRSGSWYAMTEALVAATVWLAACGIGPTLSGWALTGYHRLSPPRRGNGNRLLREV